MRISIRLWSLNKWIRFTGFRLYYEREVFSEDDPEDYETRIGLMWWGSPFNDGSERKKADDII